MMKILLISSRELCYFSGSFFLDRIQEELEKLSEVERVEFSETNLDALQVCLEKKYDAVLDINSKLPYLILDDGSRFLDQMHAPFFNYILDHPLYHHPGLVFGLKNYHAIAIDKAHQRYMKKYYPHLKSVEYLPLGGTEAPAKEFRNRSIDLLFSGTYLDREMVNRELHGKGQVNRANQQIGHFSEEDLFNLSMRLIERWNPEESTMERALWDLLYENYGHDSCENENYEVESIFPELMNRLYAVDRYMRNEIRTEILLSIAEAGLHLTVLGEGWEKTPLSTFENVDIIPGCPMDECFQYMANSKVVLDINPLFSEGLHDRVTSAWMNGAVCVTNMNPLTAPEGAKDCTIFYQRSNVQQMIERISTITDEELEKMAEKSYCMAKQNCTWEKVAKQFLEMVKHRKKGIE